MLPLRRLDEAQLDVLRQCREDDIYSIWIEGFAGSGKSVLLIHALQEYVIKNPKHKVCVVVFTRALLDLLKSGISPNFRDSVKVMTYLNFVDKDKENYDLIVVDEVQDIPVKVLEKIKARAKKMIVGGDDAQSIYIYGSRGDKIEAVLNPVRLRLPMVYRLTKKIIKIVKTILPEGVMVSATSGRAEDIQVALAHANNKDSEFSWVWKQAKRFTETRHPSVIILPNHISVQEFIRFVADFEGIGHPPRDLDNWGKNIDYSKTNAFLRSNDLSVILQYLGNAHGSLETSSSRPIVYVMTYHSAKGLDFRTVFLPQLNSHVEFWRDDPEIDRRLFFVGMTRSRRDLFLSYHSEEPHQYVLDMPQGDLRKIDIAKESTNLDEDFIF